MPLPLPVRRLVMSCATGDTLDCLAGTREFTRSRASALAAVVNRAARKAGMEWTCEATDKAPHGIHLVSPDGDRVSWDPEEHWIAPRKSGASGASAQPRRTFRAPADELADHDAAARRAGLPWNAWLRGVAKTALSGGKEG